MKRTILAALLMLGVAGLDQTIDSALAQEGGQAGAIGELPGESTWKPPTTVYQLPTTASHPIANQSVSTLLFFRDWNAREVTELRGDLAIMSEVLAEATRPGILTQMEQLPGPGLFAGRPPQSGGSRIEASYIEGFGAMFTIELPLALHFDETEETEAAPVEATTRSSPWEEARRRLAGSSPAQIIRTGARYSHEESQTILTNVIQGLGEATNIRHLEPDDFVAVILRSGTPRPIRQRTQQPRTHTREDGVTVVEYVPVDQDVMETPSEVRLRVSVSDLEAEDMTERVEKLVVSASRTVSPLLNRR